MCVLSLMDGVLYSPKMESLTNELEKLDIAYSIVYVSNKEDLAIAVRELSTASAIAFDAEGVKLGRSGPLTVAAFGAIDSSASLPIYVVDVQELGGNDVFGKSDASSRSHLEIIFSKSDGSLRSLLENKTIEKVTFDCRADSDALFHQFGVKLNGVLDMQVLDQGIRIHKGSVPPQKCQYLTSGEIPALPNMDTVAARLGLSTAKLPKPHAYSSQVWAERPLKASAIAYAANDVHVIRQMFIKSRSVQLERQLKNAVMEHSKRYEGMFRDLDSAAHSVKMLDKTFLCEEHPIIQESALPTSHPRLPAESQRQSLGREKWDAAVHALLTKDTSNPSKVFNNVLFILQHNDWYTTEAYAYLRQLSASYPFTAKQRARIRSPPKLERSEDYDDDYYCDSDDDSYSYY